MYARTDSPIFLCRKCNNKIPIVELEETFREELKVFFSNPEKLQTNLDRAAQTLKEKEELLDSHQHSVQKLRDTMQQTHRLCVEGHITPKGFGDFYKPAEAQLEQLLAELPKLQADVDFMRVNRISAEAVITESNSIYDRWPRLPLDERRKIAEAVCEKIVVADDGIDISYSGTQTSGEPCNNLTRLCARCR